jgi:hypothetical protein
MNDARAAALRGIINGTVTDTTSLPGGAFSYKINNFNTAGLSPAAIQEILNKDRLDAARDAFGIESLGGTPNVQKATINADGTPITTGTSKASVSFDVMPNVTEAGGVNWEEISDIRAPSSILIYTGTPARTFQIEAQFISRTEAGAAYTEQRLNILRSWRMPQNSALNANGGQSESSITIPDIIILSGYGGMFKNIPVVMTSLSINLNNDSDILKVSSTGTNIPINIPISISLKECHNTDSTSASGTGTILSAITSFDIQNFRDGTLESW